MLQQLYEREKYDSHKNLYRKVIEILPGFLAKTNTGTSEPEERVALVFEETVFGVLNMGLVFLRAELALDFKADEKGCKKKKNRMRLIDLISTETIK